MIDVMKQLSLIREFRRFQVEWLIKTPKQKWQVVFNFGASVSKLLGVRSLTDMKNDMFSYIMAVLICIYASLVSYTMWYNFKQGEFLKGIECTYTAGIVTVVRVL